MIDLLIYQRERKSQEVSDQQSSGLDIQSSSVHRLLEHQHAVLFSKVTVHCCFVSDDY